MRWYDPEDTEILNRSRDKETQVADIWEILQKGKEKFIMMQRLQILNSSLVRVCQELCYRFVCHL